MISLKLVRGAELAEGVATDMQLPAPLSRFSIGRDPANQWAIDDRTLAISARHCEIVATAAGAALRDLSTNGTFVNGGATRLAGDHLLQDGDQIELGPYTIAVRMTQPRAAAPPARGTDVAPSALAATAAAPPARSVGVADTAPLRGGDPAAMLAAGSRPQREGLTEILRSAPPAEDSGVEVTKIRPAPRPPAPMHPYGAGPRAAAVATPSAAGAALPTPSSSPVPQAAPAPAPSPFPTPMPAPRSGPADAPATAEIEPTGMADVDITTAWVAAPSATVATGDGIAPGLQQLAIGLGMAPDALAGRDPAQATAQLGALARAAIILMRQLLEQQAQGRREIGSRAPALLAVRDVHQLRLAPTPEAALLALLAPGADADAALQRAAADLAAHQRRMFAAFRAAATRLGRELAPASLEAALGIAPSGPAGAARAVSVAERARLWDLYTQLWQDIGLAAGQPWEQGFVEAAMLHLSAAYDEQGKP